MESKNMPLKILVIISAYNEQDNIGAVLSSINNITPYMDYIVINDCSNDNTLGKLKELNVSYIDLPVNLGIGGSVQTGYIFALKNNYDIAIQMDGDGQHDAFYLNKLVQPLIDGTADAVIGSRYLNKEGFQSSLLRRLGIRFLSTLIHICIGTKIYDVTSVLRAVNKKMIALFATNYAQDYPEPEAIVTAAVHGTRIKEVSVTMKQRSEGASSISGFKSFYYMIKVSLSVVFLKV